jgi:predicted dehydrogenase
MTFYGDRGVVSDTWKRNVDLFHDAYVAPLADFATCVHTGRTPKSTGEDARAALAIALAAVPSYRMAAQHSACWRDSRAAASGSPLASASRIG